MNTSFYLQIITDNIDCKKNLFRHKNISIRFYLHCLILLSSLLFKKMSVLYRNGTISTFFPLKSKIKNRFIQFLQKFRLINDYHMLESRDEPLELNLTFICHINKVLFKNSFLSFIVSFCLFVYFE